VSAFLVPQASLGKMRLITTPSHLDYKHISTDLTDEEWHILAPLLPPEKSGGRPRTYPLREVLNGIQYLLRGGCAWRLMPHDLPQWQTAYQTWRGFVKLLRLRLSSGKRVPFPGPTYPLGRPLRARNFGPMLESIPHLFAVRRC
jgi:hypothetical protein